MTKYLIKSIIGGIMIALGGTVFLSIDNKIIGSLLFSIGLFMIVTKDLNLYTGKIGYILCKDSKYLLEVFITLIGNFIGTFLVGFVLRYTRIAPLICENAKKICDIKLNDNILSIFILSIFCGFLMYLAVNGYKVMKDNFGKYAGVFLGVMVFILCGFEHCVANMYYFSIANMWNIKSFLYLLIMILGNSVGSILLQLADSLIFKLDKKVIKFFPKVKEK